MNLNYPLVLTFLFLSACSIFQSNETLDLSQLDAKQLDRSLGLYSCSRFLELFTEARAHLNDPEDQTQKTIEKSEAARVMARDIVLQLADEGSMNKEQLVSQVSARGYEQALEMVKEIGASEDPDLKDELFFTCFHKIRKEELLNTVNAFGGRPIE